MEHRYSLRFDNGERRGETIALSGSGATVGRKPGNSVQILDASVSGHHAELVVSDGGVTVRDLGSTNGTRVGNERISERLLAHGDLILFGNVRMTFADRAVDAEPPRASAPAADSQAAGEAMQRISSEKVARTRSKPIAAIAIAVVAVAGIAAGYVWWSGRASAGDGAALVVPVEPVAGNLLADGYSFEGSSEASAWASEESAPAAFDVDPAARRSGANGLASSVAAGEWALARSPEARVDRGRSLAATAWIQVEGEAQAVLALHFESSTQGAAPTLVWSAPLGESEGFEPVELRADVPPGYDRCRLAVLARSTGAGGGSVDVDDASLVPAVAAGAPLSVDEYQFALAGEPATAAVLFKIDRTMISGISARGPGDRAIAARGTLTAEKRDGAVRLALAAPENVGSNGPRLDLYVEPRLAALGLATLGPSGRRTHQVEFTRDDVTSVLCGTGKDLVRLGFDAPVAVTGRPEGGGFALDVALGAERALTIQLTFRAERDAAQTLARAGREAERAGRLGECLAAWQRLEDEAPYEPALLAEADEARARLFAIGRAELRGLETEAERARFFRLVDLFRSCRASADSLAARFAGSEIERSVRDLAAAIDVDLAALEADLHKAEVARLEAIAAALDAQNEPKLAARVRTALTQLGGGR